MFHQSNDPELKLYFHVYSRIKTGIFNDKLLYAGIIENDITIQLQ
jgi:hypothetical protein